MKIVLPNGIEWPGRSRQREIANVNMPRTKIRPFVTQFSLSFRVHKTILYRVASSSTINRSSFPICHLMSHSVHLSHTQKNCARCIFFAILYFVRFKCTKYFITILFVIIPSTHKMSVFVCTFLLSVRLK